MSSNVFNVLGLISIIVGIVLFWADAPAVSLGLALAVAGLFAGIFVAADQIENVVFGSALGASIGLVIGGLVGVVAWRRPAASRRFLTWAAVGFGIAGIAAVPVMTALWNQACRDPENASFCYHGLAVIALFPADAAFLVLLLVASIRSQRARPAAPRPAEGTARDRARA